MKKKIFWLVGEKSGDLHAASVLKYCRSIHPDWEHFGVGGKLMQAEGFHSLFHFNRFNVMGFVEVLKHLNFFAKVENDIEVIFSKQKPDAVVLVDYPGLNMRIAKLAKKHQIKVLYYICPQFWAWKKHRIYQLRDYSDAIGYILPFEGEYFADSNILATYTGHPISEEISVNSSRAEFAAEYDLDNQKKWLAFFPGSRDNEIKKLLPVFLKAMRLLLAENCQFLLSRTDTVSTEIFDKYIREIPVQGLKIIEGSNYELMKHADFVCAKSGTTTLETAFLGTPLILCYKTNWLSYLLGRYFVKIKWIGLPNIILNKNLIPELIQSQANALGISTKIKYYLDNRSVYKSMQTELAYLHELLGKKSASKEVTLLLESLVN
ncbi:MAG: lipid-A-disaccharide synthase [Candidatus Cloacimonetes bacterium]|nr:lipid-A-disaccharide synthase [Candidatus Cloacimonadota bacterium]